MIDIPGRSRLNTLLCYAVAVLLAAAAQAARYLLVSRTGIPFISYVPFILTSGALGGLAPGLLTTALCCLESLFFAIEPLGTFAIREPDNRLGLAALALTGIIGSVSFELLIRARRTAIRLVENRQSMLESMTRNSPAAMALFDGPDFSIRLCNPAWQALAPGEVMLDRNVAAVWPEAAVPILALLNHARSAGTAQHATAYPLNLHRVPGLPPELRYFDFSFVPLPAFATEACSPVLAVLIEVTQHKSAQQSLERANSELTALYDNAPVMLLVVDHQLRVEKSNLLAGPIGRRPGDTLGCLNALDAACGDSPGCAACAVRSAILDSLRDGALHTNIEGVLPVAVNGRPQQLSLLVSAARMQFDNSTKVLVCAQDVTPMKTSQRQLEAALAEKTVLLQEVHHRVKNNLAVISSLLGMKLDSSDNPEVRAALEQSRQRVHSMALIHELLYASDRYHRVDFAEYARQLARGFETDRISIQLDLTPVELTIERAVPCGLILNELLTNAFKYAFPGGRPGKIQIGLRQPAPATLELTIEDDGVGYTPTPNAQSLGLRIVRILANQLDAAIQQSPPPGTRLTLTLTI